MKKKLMAAMILFAVQVNGMEETQVLVGGRLPNESMSVEGGYSPYERVNELEKYYKSESRKKGKCALQDLNEVFDEEARKSFFGKLVLEDKNLTNDRALLEFIRAAAKTIIHSPEYSDESLMDCSNDSVDESSPDFVYQPPFLFSLVERLDPITWHYIRKVQASY